MKNDRLPQPPNKVRTRYPSHPTRSEHAYGNTLMVKCVQYQSLLLKA